MGLRNEFTCQKFLNLIIHRHRTDETNSGNRNQKRNASNRGSYDTANKASLADAFGVTSGLRLVGHYDTNYTANKTNNNSKPKKQEAAATIPRTREATA